MSDTWRVGSAEIVLDHLYFSEEILMTPFVEQLEDREVPGLAADLSQAHTEFGAALKAWLDSDCSDELNGPMVAAFHRSTDLTNQYVASSVGLIQAQVEAAINELPMVSPVEPQIDQWDADVAHYLASMLDD